MWNCLSILIFYFFAGSENYTCYWKTLKGTLESPDMCSNTPYENSYQLCRKSSWQPRLSCSFICALHPLFYNRIGVKNLPTCWPSRRCWRPPICFTPHSTAVWAAYIWKLLSDLSGRKALIPACVIYLFFFLKLWAILS